jgi:hypothetical protein
VVSFLRAGTETTTNGSVFLICVIRLAVKDLEGNCFGIDKFEGKKSLNIQNAFQVSRETGPRISQAHVIIISRAKFTAGNGR